MFPEDTELRKEIFKDREGISFMLNRIGFAEMQREIEKRVLPLADRIRLSEDMKVCINKLAYSSSAKSV